MHACKVYTLGIYLFTDLHLTGMHPTGVYLLQACTSYRRASFMNRPLNMWVPKLIAPGYVIYYSIAEVTSPAISRVGSVV
jgi:hypothetical protein